MSTTINLNIKGLALCFMDKVNWNVIFICDSYHHLSFRHPGTTKPQDLHVTGRQLDFSFPETSFVNVPTIPGSDFNDIFNMAWPEIHGHGKLKLKPRASWKIDSVWLKAPHSKLNASLFNAKNYWAQEVDSSLNGMGPRIPFGKLARTEAYIRCGYRIQCLGWQRRWDCFRVTFSSRKFDQPARFLFG